MCGLIWSFRWERKTDKNYTTFAGYICYACPLNLSKVITMAPAKVISTMQTGTRSERSEDRGLC